MKTEFNKWWNKDLLTEDNPYVEGTPAFWAWEGWLAGVKAEREACVKVADRYVGADPIAEAIRARGRNAA
jgi:hypothetical protein